jgi:hypothetical protein
MAAAASYLGKLLLLALLQLRLENYRSPPRRSILREERRGRGATEGWAVFSRSRAACG